MTNMFGGNNEQWEALKKKIEQDRLYCKKTALDTEERINIDLPHDNGWLRIDENGDVYIWYRCEDCDEPQLILLFMGSYEEIEKLLRAMGYLQDIE